ncbi:MAG TPA: hypothetical protein VGR78_10330 [Verrucomicrobiae bacterium]|jgi:prefoldin subunit 5|nr:hypothetical protein [Verrucomicrobiae bacterium]
MRQEYLDPPKPRKERGAIRVVRPTLKAIKAELEALKRKERELKNLPGKALLLGAHPEAIEKEVKERQNEIDETRQQLENYLSFVTKPANAIRSSLPKKKQREMGLMPAVR